MVCAHFGIAVAVIGVCLSVALSVERDLRLAPGQTADIGPYQFQFVRLREHEGANFTATRAYFDVKKDGITLARLQPEKRIYNASRQSMTEAAIDPGLTRDLYIAMGEPLGNDAWAIRVYYKPYVRCIWLGGLLMAIGGVLSISDRRYRRVDVKVPAQPGVTA
jgi:cytochrome c-type biogenesis protein CcmF